MDQGNLTTSMLRRMPWIIIGAIALYGHRLCLAWPARLRLCHCINCHPYDP